MKHPTPTLPSFSAMLRDALGHLIDPQATSLVDMMHPDAVFEFPYAPAGTPKLLQGHAALKDHVIRLSGLISLDSFSSARVHRTLQDGVSILEFTCTGSGVTTGEPYDQTYISVITTRDGRISRYVDYWNPLVVLRAVGGQDALASAMMAEVQHA